MSTVATILALLATLPIGLDDDRLNELLRGHFLAKTRSQRLHLQKEIIAVDGLTPEKLATAIRSLQLWEDQPTGEYETTVRLRKGKSSDMTVWIHVPEKYDPARRWPLVITLHGRGGKALSMLRLTRQMLGNRADGFIIAAPQDLGPLGFNMPSHVVARPRNLLNALRRRFHVDSDRVILMGYSRGSHDAWMATVMHADCFAGVVPLATHLQVVGGSLLYDELMPNARNTAILFCWGKLDTLDADGNPHPTGGNARSCRKMSAVIGALGFEHFDAVEIGDVGHMGVVPPPDLLTAVLDQSRARYPKEVRQVFRLPDQSDAYWVRADRLAGEPLPNGTLNVPVAPDEDPVTAQRKWLIGRLGLVEARCKGQTIKLRARRAPHVVLLLSDELLDLDRPVKIMRSKKKRFEGKIKRDMRVMLTEAARGWDFDRLPTARVVVPLGGKVKFGYPTADK